MQSLKRYGLVEQDEVTSLYGLGLNAWLLSRSARPYTSLQRKTRRYLEELANVSQETSFFTVVEGVHSLCVDRVERGQGLRFSMEVGSTAPLHLGASNLVLLAHLEPAQQEAVLHHWLTVPERPRFYTTLEAVRQQGYVYTAAQLTPGVAALAVPVLDQARKPLGGLSVGGYAERLTREVAEAFLPELRRVSRDLADALEVSKMPEESFV